MMMMMKNSSEKISSIDRLFNNVYCLSVMRHRWLDGREGNDISVPIGRCAPVAPEALAADATASGDLSEADASHRSRLPALLLLLRRRIIKIKSSERVYCILIKMAHNNDTREENDEHKESSWHDNIVVVIIINDENNNAVIIFIDNNRGFYGNVVI